MSLAYQFVTPLTSMTIRGVADEDGLEPVVDKPPEGRARPGARGRLWGPQSSGPLTLPFLSLPDALPLGEFLNRAGLREGLLGPCRQLGPQPRRCPGSREPGALTQLRARLREPASARPGRVPRGGSARPRRLRAQGASGSGERGPGLQGVVGVTLAHACPPQRWWDTERVSGSAPPPRVSTSPGAPGAARSALSRRVGLRTKRRTAGGSLTASPRDPRDSPLTRPESPYATSSARAPRRGQTGGLAHRQASGARGPPALGLQACRLGGLGKGARSPREVGYHPPKCHSLPPAFKLPASQPSPTGSSADIQQLPNQVTGGEFWGGREGHPCPAPGRPQPTCPMPNLTDSMLCPQWTRTPTSSSTCPRRRIPCASISMRSPV